MRMLALLLLTVLVQSPSATAEQRGGNGGDPLQLIFDSARAKATVATLLFDSANLPATTPEAVRSWLTAALANDHDGLRRLASDIAGSRHVWIEGPNVDAITCARTNVMPNQSDVYLSFDVCESRLNLAGTSLAASLLVHEAIHHFGRGGSSEDEAFCTSVGEAIMTAYSVTEGNRNPNWAFTPALGRPDRRSQHSSVFTGSALDPSAPKELIVWGGCMGHRNVPYGCGEWLNSGGRFSLTENKWLPMDPTDAPSARSLHTAVWTGENSPFRRRMLVWGGCGMGSQPYKCSKSLADGGTYDLTTKHWTPIAPDPRAPSPRSLHSSVWTGSAMIVWGGIENYRDPVRLRLAQNTGAIFLPNAAGGGSWQAIDPMLPNTPSPRFHHSAVWTGEEMVIWGGCDEEVSTQQCNHYYNDGAAYSPGTNSWRPIGSAGTSAAPEARRLHTAVWADSLKKMIVFGGEFENEFLRTGGIYDPVTNQWSEVNYGGPSERSQPQGVWAGDRMIVFGGNGKNDTGALTFPSDLWYYFPTRNPETGGSWQRLDTRDELGGRVGHSMFWTGTEVLIWGGFSRDQTFQWTGGHLAVGN